MAITGLIRRLRRTRARYIPSRVWKLGRKLLNVNLAVIKDQVTFYPPFVTQFETDFARYVGCRYGISFCNGTSSIEAALYAVGVQAGDEVLVPGCTFHASIQPILNIGARPIFVDVDPRTLTFDAKEIGRKVTEKTRCVLVVHIWGNPADMDSICEQAQRYRLKVLEDCSHAHGATWRGRKVGGLGDIGCFSLQGSKPVSAGEGGIATTDEERYRDRLSLFGHFGRDAEKLGTTQYRCMSETGVGYKRRANPLGVCLASVDLQSLDKENQQRLESAKSIDAILERVDGVSPVHSYSPAHRGGLYGGCPILLDKGRSGITRDKLVSRLRACGVHVDPYPFPLYHRLPYFMDRSYRNKVLYNLDGLPIQAPTGASSLPVTEDISARFLLLPWSRMSRRRCKRIERTLREIL